MLIGTVIKRILKSIFINFVRSTEKMRAMKLLLLAVALLGSILVSVESASSFTFLAEKSKLHVETSVKGLRVSLKATTNVTLLSVKTQFQNLLDMEVYYKAFPYMQVGSTLRETYGTALDPGVNHLKAATKLYTHLYSYTDLEKTTTAKSSCVLEFQMFDYSMFTEGVKFLQAKSIELSGVLTEVAMKADSAKMSALANFIIAFNSICADWHNQLSDIIGELDTLDGLVFPESLKGKLETASCLTGNGHEFEQITVLSTTSIKEGFIAELDVGTPTSLKEMTHLTPIFYDGVGLRGESDKLYFVREPNETVVKLLNCSNDLVWINDKAPICHEIPLPDLCKDGLKMDSIEKILEGCYFTYSKPPIAIRLIDEGILVQGSNLTVTEDGRAIYEATPYIIYSDKEVKISKFGQELVFPALAIPAVRSIARSRLTNLNILSMKNKAFWDELLYTFNIHDYIEWIAIGIEALLAPLVFCGICLGLKNKVTRIQQQKKLTKSKRKQNQKETKALLRSSRL